MLRLGEVRMMILLVFEHIGFEAIGGKVVTDISHMHAVRMLRQDSLLRRIAELRPQLDSLIVCNDTISVTHVAAVPALEFL